MAAKRYQNPPTKRGYEIMECVSSLQKAIRRSQVDGACYWAAEIDQYGWGEYLWKRLCIIASEDVGVGDRYLPAQIEALYGMWKRYKTKAAKEARLFVAHAVVLLATADKSRYATNALIVHWIAMDEGNVRDIPDHALDRHTARGRQMGRGFEHFFEEGGKLVNPDGSEPEGTEFDGRAVRHFLEGGADEPPDNGVSYIPKERRREQQGLEIDEDA